MNYKLICVTVVIDIREHSPYLGEGDVRKGAATRLSRRLLFADSWRTVSRTESERASRRMRRRQDGGGVGGGDC